MARIGDVHAGAAEDGGPGPDLSAMGGSGSGSVVVEVKFRAEASGNHALA